MSATMNCTSHFHRVTRVYYTIHTVSCKCPVNLTRHIAKIYMYVHNMHRALHALTHNHGFTFSPHCTIAGNHSDAHFFRHVIVFTPFAATALGLVSICLLALWEYSRREEIKRILTVNDQKASIQIGQSSNSQLYKLTL